MADEVRKLKYGDAVIQKSSGRRGSLATGPWVQIGYHFVEFEDDTSDFVHHYDLQPADEASDETED